MNGISTEYPRKEKMVMALLNTLGAIPMSDISKNIGIDLATTSKTITSLEKKGFVRKERDIKNVEETGHSSITCMLTPKGKNFLIFYREIKDLHYEILSPYESQIQEQISTMEKELIKASHQKINVKRKLTDDEMGISKTSQKMSFDYNAVMDAADTTTLFHNSKSYHTSSEVYKTIKSDPRFIGIINSLTLRDLAKTDPAFVNQIVILKTVKTKIHIALSNEMDRPNKVTTLKGSTYRHRVGEEGSKINAPEVVDTQEEIYKRLQEGDDSAGTVHAPAHVFLKHGSKMKIFDTKSSEQISYLICHKDLLTMSSFPKLQKALNIAEENMKNENWLWSYLIQYVKTLPKDYAVFRNNDFFNTLVQKE